MDLMNDLRFCRCCKAQRAAEEKIPRLLVPVMVKGKKAPLWLCQFCDGDAFPASKSLEARHMLGEL